MLRILSVVIVLLVGQVSSAFAVMEEANKAFNEKRYADAAVLLKPLAEKGIPAAQYYLGRLYQMGKGVGRDDSVGLMWVRRAADQSWSDAQYALGVFAHDKKNYAEALSWFRKAAEKGHPDSEYQLAMMNIRGQGVLENFNDGKKWLERAAEHGVVLAQYELGDIYARGLYGYYDAQIAILWLRRAAENAIQQLDQAESK